MKTEQKKKKKTIPTEDEYVQQEANKLSQDANTLFPDWELFGRIKNFGCVHCPINKIPHMIKAFKSIKAQFFINLTTPRSVNGVLPETT